MPSKKKAKTAEAMKPVEIPVIAQPEQAERVAYIFLGGKIDTERVAELQAQMLSAEQECDTIIIRICSPGGEIDAGLAIYDTIRLSRCKTVTEGWGQCYSIAALILTAGDTRKLAPNARVMVHPAKLVLKTTLDRGEVSDLLDGLDYATERYRTLLAERTGQPVNIIREWISKETYFNAAEALTAGFVSGIMAK